MEPGRVGTGRFGTGLAGTGLAGTGREPAALAVFAGVVGGLAGVVVLVGEPRSWLLRLPYTKPPLSLNARQHHMARWRAEQRLIGEVVQLAQIERIPALGRCSVQLHYRPTSNRRRDTDNLMATLKPVADGLVAAGVVVDDTPEFMVRPEPVIHPAEVLSPAKALSAQILWVVVSEVAR